jgi:hypothetical protein
LLNYKSFHSIQRKNDKVRSTAPFWNPRGVKAICVSRQPEAIRPEKVFPASV